MAGANPARVIPSPLGQERSSGWCAKSGVFGIFGEDSPLLSAARAQHRLDQAECNTRIRSKSSLARPYI